MVPSSLFVTSPSNTPPRMVPSFTTAPVNVVVPAAPSLPVMAPLLVTTPLTVPPLAYRVPSRVILTSICALPLMVKAPRPKICCLPVLPGAEIVPPLTVMSPLKRMLPPIASSPSLPMALQLRMAPSSMMNTPSLPTPPPMRPATQLAMVPPCMTNVPLSPLPPPSISTPPPLPSPSP